MTDEQATVRLEIEWTFSVAVGVEASSEVLGSHVSLVMEELAKLVSVDGSQISDPALSLDAAERTVVVELEALGDTYPAAANIGLSAIRTAIHAAGGFTPNWPSMAEVLVPGDSNMKLIDDNPPVHAGG